MLAYNCYGCHDKGCGYCQPEKVKYVPCPFCDEKDFDLIGLKHHLENGHCEIFNSTERL